MGWRGQETIRCMLEGTNKVFLRVFDVRQSDVVPCFHLPSVYQRLKLFSH